MLLDRAPDGWHIPERQRSDLQLPRRRFDEDTDSFAVSLPSAGGAPGTFRPLSDNASGAAAAQPSSERPAGLHQPPRQSAADAGPSAAFPPAAPESDGPGAAPQLPVVAPGSTPEELAAAAAHRAAAARSFHLAPEVVRANDTSAAAIDEWTGEPLAPQARPRPTQPAPCRTATLMPCLPVGQLRTQSAASGLQQFFQQQPFNAGLPRLVNGLADHFRVLSPGIKLLRLVIGVADLLSALDLGIEQYDCRCRSQAADAGRLWRQRRAGRPVVRQGRGRVRGAAAGFGGCEARHHLALRQLRGADPLGRWLQPGDCCARHTRIVPPMPAKNTQLTTHHGCCHQNQQQQYTNHNTHTVACSPHVLP